MYLTPRYPVDVFKIVVVLCANKPCRAALAASPVFLFVLRSAVETGDESVLSSVPVILQQCGLNGQVLGEMSRIGFLGALAGQAARMDGADFIAVTDLLAGVGNFPDAPLFTQLVLVRLSEEKFLSAALAVLLRLAAYSACANAMTTANLIPYLEDLANYPRYADPAGKLLAKLGAAVKALKVVQTGSAHF
jgi:hypothetical protein